MSRTVWIHLKNGEPFWFSLRWWSRLLTHHREDSYLQTGHLKIYHTIYNPSHTQWNVTSHRYCFVDHHTVAGHSRDGNAARWHQSSMDFLSTWRANIFNPSRRSESPLPSEKWFAFLSIHHARYRFFGLRDCCFILKVSWRRRRPFWVVHDLTQANCHNFVKPPLISDQYSVRQARGGGTQSVECLLYQCQDWSATDGWSSALHLHASSAVSYGTWWSRGGK